VSYHLTFDVDWAPDWAVRDVLDILRAHDAPATFFVTHPSPINEEIASNGHEVGIHPNFLPGSSHGVDPLAVMRSVLELAPAARVMRTHSLVQGTTLFEAVLAAHPQIQYDMSLMTYGSPHTGWTDWHSRGRRMRRHNYNWEDDIAFDDTSQDWTTCTAMAPLDVYDFHPIHVALNSSREDAYMSLKAHRGPGWLHEAEQDESLVFREPGPGTADFLRAVLTTGRRALTFEELL
jgi:peptidoglycan/xylan/chitin deacetylase (PgdA/CDA1 family)